MTFQSPVLLLAFGLALLLRVSLRTEAQRKWLTVTCGLLFYATWDASFLPMLLVYTVASWAVGLRIATLPDGAARRWASGGTITLLVGLLAWFKYRAFLAELLAGMGLAVGASAIPLAPIGVSFFTFELVSYIVDIRRRRIAPIRSLLDFATFFLFFPRMIAGPIVRPADFIRQLDAGALRHAPPLLRGAELFVAGAIFKTVIADAQSPFVEAVFRDPGRFDAATGWLALVAYAVQIFGDFFGYSLMAAGLARGFGFVLPRNFAAPYAAVGLSDFWQRWHISLSQWLRDYLYIPLGGSRHGEWRTALALVGTMVLGGLWHGAGWNFVLWGGAHGLLLVVERGWRRWGPTGGTRPVRALALLVTLGCCGLLCLPFRSTGWANLQAMTATMLGQGGINRWISPWALLGAGAVAVFHLAHETSPAIRRFFDAEALGDDAAWRVAALGVTVSTWVVWAQSAPSTFIYFQF